MFGNFVEDLQNSGNFEFRDLEKGALEFRQTTMINIIRWSPQVFFYWTKTDKLEFICKSLAHRMFGCGEIPVLRSRREIAPPNFGRMVRTLDCAYNLKRLCKSQVHRIFGCGKIVAYGLLPRYCLKFAAYR